MSTSRSPKSVAKVIVAASIALAATVLACGGGVDQAGPGTPPKPALGIKVIAGLGVTDTIDAVVAQPLTVEVRDSSGALAANATVQFWPVQTRAPLNVRVPGAYLVGPPGDTTLDFTTPLTDAAGRASAVVRLGTVAGIARISVSVPSLGLADTVQFTVTPGAPTKLVSSVADTGVTVGHSVSIGVAVSDRAGNARNDPVVFDGPDAPNVAAVSPAGVVTGLGLGHTTISAHVGSARAATSIEVVPDGTIAGYDESTGNLAIVNLDGTGLRLIGKPIGWDGSSLAWGSSGNLLYASDFRLYTMNSAGVSSPLDITIPSGTNQKWPEYSAAARATFYSSPTQSGYSWRLWKCADDGTQAEVMAEPTGGLEWRATVSPDGTKLAYVTTAGNGAIIKVYDMLTATSSACSVPGQFPRWSPAGNLIAFVPSPAGPVEVMNADGSNVRALTTSIYSEQRVDWSADGAWILATSRHGSIDIVNPATGSTLSIGYLARFSAPAWKR